MQACSSTSKVRVRHPSERGLLLEDNFDRHELLNPRSFRYLVVALDSWNELSVLQHAPWLGRMFCASILREAGMTTGAHLAAINLGLKTIPVDRRRHRDRETRLLAIAHGLIAAAETGLKEHDRLALARTLFERKLSPADRFHEIQQYEPGELIFDRNYLAGPRSDDFVVFAIRAGRPRSTETRKAFFKRAAELLSEAPGLRKEDIMITIVSSQPDEWSFGDGVAQMADDNWRARAMGEPS